MVRPEFSTGGVKSEFLESNDLGLCLGFLDSKPSMKAKSFESIFELSGALYQLPSGLLRVVSSGFKADFIDSSAKRIDSSSSCPMLRSAFPDLLESRITGSPSVLDI